MGNNIFYLQQMQSVELLTKKNKQSSKRYPDILNKTREDNFNNRYSLNEKAKIYQALSDPYTSYYFSNKAVKDHLKQFKKAIRYEPNFTEKTRINKLITLRMKEKLQDFLCPKTSIYQKSLGETDIKRINQKSSKSISTQRPKELSPNSTQVNHTAAEKIKPLTTRKQTQRLPRIKNSDTINPSQQNSPQDVKPQNSVQGQRQKGKKSTIKQSQQKQFADRLAQELHQKKHDKWLIFLEQKKKQLAARQNVQQSNK